MKRSPGLSYEKLIKTVDCPYTLVIAAARRARKLNEGAAPLLNRPNQKSVTLAIDEIIEGKIDVIYNRAESIK